MAFIFLEIAGENGRDLSRAGTIFLRRHVDPRFMVRQLRGEQDVDNDGTLTCEDRSCTGLAAKLIPLLFHLFPRERDRKSVSSKLLPFAFGLVVPSTGHDDGDLRKLFIIMLYCCNNYR